MQRRDFQSFISKLREKLTPLYTARNAGGGAHDVWHVIRMIKLGERIRSTCKLEFKREEYEVAVWLHNIDRVRPYTDDIASLKKIAGNGEEAFAESARSFFVGIDSPFSAYSRDRIVDAVVQHSKKDDEPGDSYLLTALRIADKLDRLSPLGILSCATCLGTQVPLYDPECPLGYGSTAEGRMKSVYDNLFRVLEWVGMLPSDEARSLVDLDDLSAYLRFMRALGFQLSRECNVKNVVEDDIRKALGAYYTHYGRYLG